MEKFITRLITEMSESFAVIIAKLNALNTNKANIKLDNIPANLTEPEKQAFRTKIGATSSTEIGTDFILKTEKGANNGVATLDAGGKVPASQLPSYVDDVVELVAFVATAPTSGMVAGQKRYITGTKKIFTSTGATAGTSSDPENDKIYTNISDNLIYRWSGSDMIRLNEGVVLGETSTTAYRGDRGKIAYDHSQITNGNPHGTTMAQIAGLDTAIAGKVDLNLGNASSSLSVAEKTAFRTKIGAGTGAGTVTSIGMTVPVGLAVAPPTITTAGTFAITFQAGYSLPSIVKQGQWDVAYTHSVDMGDAKTAIPDWSAELTAQVNF